MNHPIHRVQRFEIVAPYTFHDWPRYRDEFIAMARRWATGSDTDPTQRIKDSCRAEPRHNP
jgi:hypothetical protein